MALINCPECNREVSSIAEKCVHCGYPINNPKPTQTPYEIIKEIEDFYDSLIHPKFTFENMRLPDDWKFW